MFRVMDVGGTLNTHYFHSEPYPLEFPSVDAARAYAEEWNDWPGDRRRKLTLYNVVGAGDTVVHWSSYGVKVGRELTPGDWA